MTAGDNGLPGVIPAPFLGLRFNNQVSFYYLALVALLGSYAALIAVTRSQFRQVLRGIRENELRVRFAGYHVEQYKTVAFGISAFFAGLAGALNAFHERVASPETLGWALSGDAVLYSTLGGTGTLLGPVLGAALVILARELLSDFFRSWLIFVGLIYIALVVFLPAGLYPLLIRRDDRDEPGRSPAGHRRRLPMSQTPPDTLNEIGVLRRREIEARVLMPVLKRLGAEFGEERVFAVAREVIVEVAREQGRELAGQMGGSSLTPSRRPWKIGRRATPTAWRRSSRRTSATPSTSRAVATPRCTAAWGFPRSAPCFPATATSPWWRASTPTSRSRARRPSWRERRTATSASRTGRGQRLRPERGRPRRGQR